MTIWIYLLYWFRW